MVKLVDECSALEAMKQSIWKVTVQALIGQSTVTCVCFIQEKSLVSNQKWSSKF